MDINVLKEAFINSWGSDTCYPDLKDEWIVENIELGQCAVTTLVVNDYLGGKIKKVKVKDSDITHYFNEIDGQEVDFTRGQFKNGEVLIEEVYKERASLLKAEHTRIRYEILRNRVKEYLVANNYMIKREASYIIFYESDNILLLNKGEQYKYKYGLPGGKIEEGESKLESLIREMEEEIDYEANESELEYIGETNCQFKYGGEMYDHYTHVYVSPLESKKDKLVAKENATIEVVSLKKAKELPMTPPTLDSIKLAEEWLNNK